LGSRGEKNRPHPCCRSPFLYNFTLDYKGNFKVTVVVSKSTPCRVKRRRAAGAATPDALLVRAPERNHVHRRGVLYILLNVPSPIPHRHMPPRLGKQLGPTPWRSRSLVRTLPRGASLFRSRYRPKAGVEPSGGGPPPDLHTLYARSLRLGTHVISHPPLVRARRSAARGQCGRAELALRHRCVRCRPDGAVARAKVLSWPQIG
jgi:hypothetical protein